MSIQEHKHSGRLPLARKSREEMDRRKPSLKENRKEVFATASLALTILLPLGHSWFRSTARPRPGLPGHYTRSSTAGQLIQYPSFRASQVSTELLWGQGLVSSAFSAPGGALAHNYPLRKAGGREEGGRWGGKQKTNPVAAHSTVKSG